MLGFPRPARRGEGATERSEVAGEGNAQRTMHDPLIRLRHLLPQKAGEKDVGR
jgi:hypothetical protein